MHIFLIEVIKMKDKDFYENGHFCKYFGVFFVKKFQNFKRINSISLNRAQCTAFKAIKKSYILIN